MEPTARTESLRRRAARGTLINSAFQIGLAGLGLLRRLLVAFFLTRTEFGVWSILVTTLITLSWLKQIGIQDKYVQQQDENQEHAFQKAFTLELLASLAFVALIAVVMPLYALAYGTSSILIPGLVLALSVPLSAFEAPAWIFYRRMDFVRQRTVSAVDPIVAFVVTVALGIAGLGYWCLVVGSVAGSVVGGIVAVKASPYRLAFRFDRGTLREYASFSWPLVGFGVSNLLIVQGSFLVGSRIVGLAGLGAVGLAGSISAFADRVDGIVSQTIYPAVCRVADQREKLFEAFIKSNRLALIWGLPFGVALALFAGDLVTFGFGEQWRAAAGLIGAYGLIAGFRQVAYNYSIFMRAVNETRPIFIASLVNLITFLAIGVPAILAFGLPGYPIGFAAMAGIQIATRGYFLARLFSGFKLARHLVRAVIPSVPPAAVVLLIRLAWPGPRSLARALFELGLYIVLTVAATLLIERSLMREMWGYLMPERSRRARGAGGPRAKHPWWRTPRAAFFAIVFVALAARLGVAGWAHGLPVIADPADYVRHAVSIAHGHGYPQTAVAFGGPTALRPPAWPYTLGATFAVTHDSIDAARTLQALFGTMAVVLLGLVGRQLWGRRIGLMAMAIGAIYPPWLLLGASLFSEPLFMVLELGALAAALHGRREGGLRWWALCGVLAGLGVLTRANGALLLVPLALLAWTGRPRFGVRALALPALVVAAAALTIVPWTVRNAVTMHAFIPVTTQSGYTLAGAYNDTARHDPREPAAWRVASVDPAYAQLLTDRPGEATLNGRLESKATSYIADHPSYVGTVFLWNLRRFLHLGRYDFARSSYAAYGVPRRAQDIAILSFYPLLLLALLGAVTRAARRAPWPIWLFPVTMLSVLFIEAGMRFRAPIEPFLVLLAAVGLERGLSLIRERWRRPRQLELSADAQPLAGQPAPVP